MSKRFIFGSIILCFNLLLVFFIGELYARTKHGDMLDIRAREASYRKVDFQLHHSFIPDSTGRSITKEWDVTYDINSFGLRDRDYPVVKPESTCRILVLGDSFTEGYGVEIEDAFVKILERRLNGISGEKPVYEVINCGIAGYSPLLEYLFLVKKGLQLNPDMVVLFYDFGDLKDDYEYERVTVFGKDGMPLGCSPLKRVRAFSSNPVEHFLLKYSRFYLYIENRMNKLLYKLKKIGFKQYINDNVSCKEHILFDKSENSDIDRFVVFRENNGYILRRLWQKNEKYIRLIHEMLRDNGVAFVLATYPYAIEINGVEWSEGRREYGFKVGEEYAEPIVVDFMRRYAEEEGIPFIDVYTYFKESDLKPLYFDFDGHFTDNGHRVMAESMFKELKKVLSEVLPDNQFAEGRVPRAERTSNLSEVEN